MLDGLHARCGGKTIPFVRMFYGSPSTNIREDGEGVEHTILQREGGEQGDPLMPLLFLLGLCALWRPPRKNSQRMHVCLHTSTTFTSCRQTQIGQVTCTRFCSDISTPTRGSASKEGDAGLEPQRDQASGMRRVAEDCAGGGFGSSSLAG